MPIEAKHSRMSSQKDIAKVAFSEVVKDVLRQDVCLESRNLLGLKR